MQSAKHDASYDKVIIRTNGTYCIFTTSIKYIISKRKFKQSLLDLQHKHGENWHKFNFDTYHLYYSYVHISCSREIGGRFLGDHIIFNGELGVVDALLYNRQ